MGVEDEKHDEKKVLDSEVPRNSDIDFGEGIDILSLQDIDPALNAKMHIVNNVGSSQPNFFHQVSLLTTHWLAGNRRNWLDSISLETFRLERFWASHASSLELNIANRTIIDMPLIL